MAEPGAPAGRIFISYRREETAYPAGWLYDRLAGRYGAGQVFKDVDSIQPGDDFVDMITRAVGSCDALLALIGKDWLTITDEEDRRRLDDPADFVRVEIEAALTRKVRVIPILVEGARMPHASEVPPSLAALVRRQALDLSPARFDSDLIRLLEVLDRTLAEVRTEQNNANRAATVRPHSYTAPDPRTHEPSTPQQSANEDKGPPAPRPSPPTAAPDTPESGKRRPVFTRGRVLTAAGAVVALIVVVVNITADPDTTPPRTGTVGTSSQTNGLVLLQDGFSDQTSGWTVLPNREIGPRGGIMNGKYWISADGPNGSAASVPSAVKGLYPRSDTDLLIEVDGRMLAGDAEASYGVACRADPDASAWYQFEVGKDYLAIAKEDRPGGWRELDLLKADGTPPAGFDVKAATRLEASCATVDGGKAVHLTLWVNGEVVAEATDPRGDKAKGAPLLSGTVALFVGQGEHSKTTAEAEFDNFVVTEK